MLAWLDSFPLKPDDATLVLRRSALRPPRMSRAHRKSGEVKFVHEDKQSPGMAAADGFLVVDVHRTGFIRWRKCSREAGQLQGLSHRPGLMKPLPGFFTITMCFIQEQLADGDDRSRLIPIIADYAHGLRVEHRFAVHEKLIEVVAVA